MTKEPPQKVSSSHCDYAHLIYVHSLRERDVFSKTDTPCGFKNHAKRLFTDWLDVTEEEGLKLAGRKTEMRRKREWREDSRSVSCARLLDTLCYLILRKEGVSSPGVVVSLS